MEAALESLNRSELEFAGTDWPTWAHDAQLPPDETGGRPDWSTWLVLGGRGSGRTRAGAEWVRRLTERARIGAAPVRIALVGPSYSEAREVMVDGVSGLNALHWRAERPQFISSRRMLVWSDGSTAHLFSAEDPEELRGPQFDAAWCDGTRLLRDIRRRPTTGCCFAGLRWVMRIRTRRSIRCALTGLKSTNLPISRVFRRMSGVFIAGSCVARHCPVN
ncbi:MAG: terminase family protein [Anderseniella sp.]|nr:terminase family protein [Anderseniella sp.]